MKICPCCKETKDFSFFYKNKTQKDGLQSYCKECFKTKIGKYSHKKKDYNKAWKENNKESASLSLRQATSRWKKANRAKATSYEIARQQRKTKACPNWLTSFDKTKMSCFYQLAKMRSKESGVEWHVDHIVPLKGKLVCGLHVPWNLQVIPAHENISKSNYFEVN